MIAKIGLLVPNEDAKTVTLRLLDGTIYGVGGSENAFQKTDFTVYDVSLNLTNLGDMRAREKDPKEMTLAELRSRITERRAQHQQQGGGRDHHSYRSAMIGSRREALRAG